MTIDNNILAISKTIFQNRADYVYVTDKQKEDFFFIINRYFSKIYPDQAQLLNDKFINKVVGMDLWFYFMKGKPYPKLFWSKSEKGKDDKSSNFTDKESNLLKDKLSVKDQEFEVLERYYLDELKDELKYYKELEKQK